VSNIRINASNVPFTAPEQQTNATEAAQQPNTVSPQTASIESAAVQTYKNPGPQQDTATQISEAFFAGNLRAAQLQAQFNQSGAAEGGASREVQQSVPILPNEAQSLSGTLSGNETQQNEAITPRDTPAFQGGVRVPLNNDLFEVNAEGNLTVNSDQLAEKLKAALKNQG
jgi:hypothetical protein